MQFETARLLLRPAEARDRDDLHCLEQDVEVMRYLNGGKPTPIQPPLGKTAFFMPRGGEAGVWAVFLRDGGAFAGWVALDDEAGEDQLGYRFARAFWGHGFATEAVQALLADAFERQGRPSVSATTMSVNARSRRVLERSGFRLSRTFYRVWQDPLPGAELGEVVYVATRGSWSSPRGLNNV